MYCLFEELSLPYVFVFSHSLNESSELEIVLAPQFMSRLAVQ